MDAIEKESLFLYKICYSIGLSSSQWKRNIQLVDCLETVCHMDYFERSNITGIGCGSRSEGISPFSFALRTLTDVDNLTMIDGINVKEHVDTTNTNQSEVLQLLYTDSPGYVLLEVKSPKSPFNNTSHIVIKHSKYLVSSSRFKVFIQRRKADLDSLRSSDSGYNVNVNEQSSLQSRRSTKSLNETTIHGPSVKSKPLPVYGICGLDAVWCLRCYEWPTAAHEWIDRARPHGWPSKDLIDQIMYDGCEIVPVGRKDHPDEDVQWKLSFSRAETRLIRHFNIYQAQCYQLLKIVKTDFISSVVSDSLSSYHIKTVMLHTVEQANPNVWRRDNLAQCFMVCLSNLKRYLTDKFLPQYFIVRHNLLEPKVTGGVRQKVLKIVTDLDKIGWKCILQCPQLRELCLSIQETVVSIPYNVITDVYALEGNKDVVLDYCSILVCQLLLTKNPVSYDSYLIERVVFCEKTFLKPTPTQPCVDIARMLQLLRKGELGLLLTVIQAIAHPELRHGIDPLMNFARQYLEESCHADVSSCRLKFATFFFHLGVYDRCIATVQDVLERFKDVWVVAGGLSKCSIEADEIKEVLENIDASKLECQLNRVLQLSDNGFPFISNHLSFPAFFTHWEIAVAPKGVQFVHKKMHSDKEAINKVCYIDSIVYAHYLLVESYLKIDKYNHAEHALINMKESILNSKDDAFDINCLFFCKEDILLVQFSDRLMQVAKNVKDELKSEQEDV